MDNEDVYKGPFYAKIIESRGRYLLFVERSPEELKEEVEIYRGENPDSRVFLGGIGANPSFIDSLGEVLKGLCELENSSRT